VFEILLGHHHAAIGEEQRRAQQVLELGRPTFVVSVKPPEGSSSSSPGRRSQVERYGLLRSDYELLVNAIPTVSGATPVRESRQVVRYHDRSLPGRLVGCTPGYFDLNHLSMAQGRFLTDADQIQRENVVVLGYETAATLFPLENPIGKTIQIKFRYYTVVGVTTERTASAAIGGSLAGQDYNKDVYIPLNTLRARLGDLDVQAAPASFHAEHVELTNHASRRRS
jgi:putative ABC transport system permease protein